MTNFFSKQVKNKKKSTIKIQVLFNPPLVESVKGANPYALDGANADALEGANADICHRQMSLGALEGAYANICQMQMSLRALEGAYADICLW